MATVGRSKSDVAIEMSAGVSHWCPLLPLPAVCFPAEMTSPSVSPATARRLISLLVESILSKY